MHNGRPISSRKAVQIMVALTVLAWATQTLYHQWGFGQILPADPIGQETFVPPTDGATARPATLELRAEASIIGSDVKLRQIARWESVDDVVFKPIADLVLVRLTEQSPFKSLTADAIRQTLADAGVNLGVVKFAGATSCMVNRSDVRFDEQKALDQWINAKSAVVEPATRPSGTEQASTNAPTPEPASVGQPNVASLRDQLLDDLCTRFQIDRDTVQIAFSPKDEKVLALSAPHFRFQITPQRVHGLGEVRWEVLILAETGSQKAIISGTARQWQKQVIVNRAMSFRQVIQDGDVLEQRVLADRLPDKPLLRLDQVLDQQAGRDLKPGTILTANLIEPAPLVRVGELVTITINQGSITIRTVAKAMEGGVFGQAIRVRNESTKEIYQVVLTGPKEATLGDAPRGNEVATGRD